LSTPGIGLACRKAGTTPERCTRLGERRRPLHVRTAIDGIDRFVLCFSDMRPEASVGKLDLYRVRYAITARPEG